MRLTNLLLGAAALCSAAPSCKPEFNGYLLSTFTDQNPRVFWYLSDPENPTNFRILNGGESVLESKVGTKGARDLYLITDTARSVYYMIATDLEITGPDFPGWEQAQRTGSKNIVVWESEDLVNWTEGELRLVESDTAGMVWAPSAVWDEETQEYNVFWASRHYQPDDPEHTGPMGVAKIRHASTKDFVSFTEPDDYIAFENTSVIDQEFQYLGKPGHYTRFVKDEDIKKVYQETTTDGIFGTWERVPGWVVDQAPFEGATSFADIRNPGLYHLLLDNYQEFVHFTASGDMTSPVWEESGNEGLPRNLKHGSVFPLTSRELEAVAGKYDTKN